MSRDLEEIYSILDPVSTEMLITEVSTLKKCYRQSTLDSFFKLWITHVVYSLVPFRIALADYPVLLPCSEIKKV